MESLKRIPLENVAQMGMDAYYRDYPNRTDFFQKEHFLLISCTTYAKIINDMYNEDKMKNKGSDGFSYANFSGPWLHREELKVQKDDLTGFAFLETSMPCFCFDFDAMSSSIHSILKKKKDSCGDLMRISNKDVWKLDNVPATNDIFYYQLSERIFLRNLKCDQTVFVVNYLPALLPDNLKCSIPETMVDGIITTVLQIMFGAKNETPYVKMANNSNPNGALATEVAPSAQTNFNQ